MKRLVLIDGNAILHRAYHALPPLTNRSGELVNAVYGFSTILLKVVDDLNPAYLAVTFDTPTPTFRKMEYLGYQAHRPVMDEELSGQIEKVHEVLEAFGVPIYAVPGFEADDVIGTLAFQATSRAEKRGTKTRKNAEDVEVVIVTGDRDIMQLVSLHVKVYAPIKGMSEAQMFDEKGVTERLGVPPSMIVDYKGLAGDQSDGYPGVPGVGPKTAVELLGKYESIDNLYQNLGDLPESLAKKLEEGKELAELSRKLAKIVTDVPIELDLEKCRFELTEEEKQKVAEKFRSMGFKSLAARMGGAKLEKDEKTKKLKNKKTEDAQQGLF